MYLPVRKVSGGRPACAGPLLVSAGSRISSHQVRRNLQMSYRSQSQCSRVAVMRLVVVAVLCGVGTLAAAQDQPAPKWEGFVGYSFLYPNSDVHALLPGGLLPVSSPLESNPRGLGGSLNSDFNRWFGLTLDGTGPLGGGETGLAKRIDDSAFYNISFGPKLTHRGEHV